MPIFSNFWNFWVCLLCQWPRFLKKFFLAGGHPNIVMWFCGFLVGISSSSKLLRLHIQMLKMLLLFTQTLVMQSLVTPIPVPSHKALTYKLAIQTGNLVQYQLESRFFFPRGHIHIRVAWPHLFKDTPQPDLIRTITLKCLVYVTEVKSSRDVSQILPCSFMNGKHICVL